jgi:hypothetical protein
MDEWTFYMPNAEEIYKIIIFDDGNEKYNNEKYNNEKYDNEIYDNKIYKNEWLIAGHWGGKIRLINKKDPSVKVQSISKWKIIKI